MTFFVTPNGGVRLENMSGGELKLLVKMFRGVSGGASLVVLPHFTQCSQVSGGGGGADSSEGGECPPTK